MDMLQVFHMNGGEGETSYSKNCAIQAKILSITNPFVVEAMQDYLSKEFKGDTLTIAELGCSSGPTALDAVSNIMEVEEVRRRVSKFMVYLVDLPSNDFNELFALLPSFQNTLRDEKGPDFGSCYITGLPGNFYERLLPDQTLHFVHSSSSLHWLSQVPSELDGKYDPSMLNKGKIHLSKTSPKHVNDAYRFQFRKDFMSFLKCRSEEVVLGGRMVLCFMGRKSSEVPFDEDFDPFELIARALMTMVSEGLVAEERVDSLNVPYYAPSLAEVKQLVEEESSFIGARFEAIDIDWDGGSEIGDIADQGLSRGAMLAKSHRAVVESLFEHHFGAHILDELFLRYGKILDNHLLSSENYNLTNLVVSLIRI